MVEVELSKRLMDGSSAFFLKVDDKQKSSPIRL
jgi:hypothetical protein